MKIPSKKIILFSVIALAAAVLAAIFVIFANRDKDTQKTVCELYFLNESGTTLVAEECEIKYYSDEDLRENLINRLITGPQDSGKKRLISKSTELLDITEESDENFVVDFSEDFLTDDSTKNSLAAYSVVKSLCALASVEQVKITVCGSDLKNAEGNTIDYLTSEDINLPTDTYTSETREITLYFPKKEFDTLYKEKRIVKITDQQPMEQYIINELIKGPADESLVPILDKNTSLLSVDTYGDICFVNFKSDFSLKNAGNANKEKMIIYSIVDSLTELKNIKRVQFLSDGKKIEKFGNTDIKNPFERDF